MATAVVVEASDIRFVAEPELVVIRGFPLVGSGKDLYRLLSVLAQRHTRNNPMALTRGGFEDQAIAKRGSILHVANLFCERPEGARLNFE